MKGIPLQGEASYLLWVLSGSMTAEPDLNLEESGCGNQHSFPYARGRGSLVTKICVVNKAKGLQPGAQGVKARNYCFPSLRHRLLRIYLSNSTERFTPHMFEVLPCKIHLFLPSSVQFYFASSNLVAHSIYYQNLTLLLYRKGLFNI